MSPTPLSTSVDPDGEFQRFVQSGDHEALGRALDQVGPRLLVLAGRWSRSVDDAEDLVQATVLSALSTGHQWDASRPLLPWLTGILTHRARDLGRRQNLRRTDPLGEEPADRRSEEDPARVTELKDDLAVMRQAIERLEDPYRELFSMRLSGTVKTSELADRLGRSAATIRVQLARGRERLEDLLPRGFGVSCLLLSQGDQVLERVKEGALAQGRAAGTMHSTAASATSKSGGGAAVLKLSLGALLLLVAAVAGWQLSRGPSTQEAPAATAALDPSGELQANLAPGPGPVARAEPSAERRPGASDQADRLAADSLTVHGTYAGAAGVEDAVGVDVYVRPLGTGDLGSSVRTDRGGLVRLGHLRPGRYGVSVAPVPGPPQEIEVPMAGPLELAIPPGALVRGRVLDFDGQPVAGATVSRRNPFHHDLAQWVATTDEAGGYRIRDGAQGLELAARAPGHQPSGGRKGSAFSRVFAAPGSESQVDLRLGARGYSVEGRVLGPGGQAAPYALVVVAVHEDARKERDGMDPAPASTGEGSDPNMDQDLDMDSFLVRADADGFFRTEEVPRGPAVLFAKSQAQPAWIGVQRVRVDGRLPSRADVLLARGASVFGRVVDDLGAPRAGRRVEAEWKGSPDLGEFETGPAEAALLGRAVTAADGSYRIVGLLGGRTGVRLAREGVDVRDEERFELASGGSQEWNPVIPVHSELSVTCLDAAGEPLVGWGVAQGDQPSRIRPRESLATDAQGRCDFTGLSSLGEAPRVITLHRPGEGSTDVSSMPVAHALVEPGSGATVLRLDRSQLGSLRGRVRFPEARTDDPSGPQAPRPRIRLVFGEFDECSLSQSVEDGSFAFDGLPSGPYALTLVRSYAGVPRGLELASFTLAPGEARDLGALEPSAGTILILELDGADSRSLTQRSIRLQEPSGASDSVRTFTLERDPTDGAFHSESLAPGDYVLLPRDEGLALQSKHLRILPGTRQQREVWVLDPGREVTLWVRFGAKPKGVNLRRECRESEGRADVWLLDDSGQLVWYDRVTAPLSGEAGDRIEVTIKVAQGDFRVWALEQRFGGLTPSWKELALSVGAAAMPPVELDLGP